MTSQYAKRLCVRAIWLSAAERDLLREALTVMRQGAGFASHEVYANSRARGNYAGRRIDDLHARLQELPSTNVAKIKKAA